MLGKQYEISAGDLTFANKPADVPTIYIDGMKGLMITPDGAKLSLFETMNDPVSENVEARFVANLAMTTAQLRALVTHLTKVLADYQEQNSPAPAKAE